MKSFLVCIPLLFGLSACQSNSVEDRTLAGGLIGAGTGAVVGGLVTGRAGGALAGAAIGGVGGAIIGNSTAPRYRTRGGCRAYDEYGDPIIVRC